MRRIVETATLPHRTHIPSIVPLAP
jgi:hypothetical protein